MIKAEGTSRQAKEDGKHTECQFLKRSAARLRVEQEDDNQLEEDPTTVDGQVLPLDCVESLRVDVGGEEAGQLSEDLLDADAAAAVRVGPNLGEVGCRLLAGALVR